MTQRLFIVRHAIAEPRGNKQRPNDDRPLTAEGIRRMTVAAAGLASLLTEEVVIMTSPLRRASRTAALIRSAVKAKKSEVASDLLLPEADPDLLIDALRERSDLPSLMLVGHEPFLGRLISRLTGLPEPSIVLKKGGCCVVRWSPNGEEPARITMLLPPKVLRSLGSRRTVSSRR